MKRYRLLVDGINYRITEEKNAYNVVYKIYIKAELVTKIVATESYKIHLKDFIKSYNLLNDKKKGKGKRG